MSLSGEGSVSGEIESGTPDRDQGPHATLSDGGQPAGRPGGDHLPAPPIIETRDSTGPRHGIPRRDLGGDRRGIGARKSSASPCFGGAWSIALGSRRWTQDSGNDASPSSRRSSPNAPADGFWVKRALRRRADLWLHRAGLRLYRDGLLITACQGCRYRQRRQGGQDRSPRAGKRKAGGGRETGDAGRIIERQPGADPPANQAIGLCAKCGAARRVSSGSARPASIAASTPGEAIACTRRHARVDRASRPARERSRAGSNRTRKDRRSSCDAPDAH